jgi:uncharacterized protein YjiS (DUF1127 family)
MTLSLEQKQQLTSQGYSSEFADQLSKKIFKALIEVHSSLIVKFSHQELVQITTLTHAGTILRVIKENFDLFLQWGFNKEIILKIASQNRGSKTLNAIKFYHPILIYIGFDTKDIINIVCCNLNKTKSYNILKEIKAYYDMLIEFGFTNTVVLQIIREKEIESSNNFSKLLQNILQFKNHKEQNIYPNHIVSAFQYLNKIHPEQYVTIEIVQDQLTRWKKFVQLKKDFFGTFKQEQMEQLTCYHYADPNKSFNALLDFAQTDNDAASTHIIAHYFACYMNNLYARIKHVNTQSIQENLFTAEGSFVYIKSYSSFYTFLEVNNITHSFPESPPTLSPTQLPAQYNLVDNWLIQKLEEIDAMEVAQQQKLDMLAKQLHEELNRIRKRPQIPQPPAKQEPRDTAPPDLITNLVKVLAQANIDEKECFYIDLETGLALKRFSLEKLQVMGIYSVKKRPSKPECIVKLVNLKQYQEFLACHQQTTQIVKQKNEENSSIGTKRKKRPLSDIQEQRKPKRQNTASADLIADLAEMLAQANKDEKERFYINEETALALKRLSPEQRKDIGISSIKKRPSKSEYVVNLFNLKRYQEFLACHQQITQIYTQIEQALFNDSSPSLNEEEEEIVNTMAQSLQQEIASSCRPCTRYRFFSQQVEQPIKLDLIESLRKLMQTADGSVKNFLGRLI